MKKWKDTPKDAHVFYTTSIELGVATLGKQCGLGRSEI
jgi:hypothetical protein